MVEYKSLELLGSATGDVLGEVAAGFAGDGEELVSGAERISHALLEALRFELATVGQARQDLLQARVWRAVW